MRKLLVSLFASALLLIGALPIFWPISSNVFAAETDPKTDALNSYLQSQQQKKTVQQQQQTNATANAEQNTKLTWPWWAKTFSVIMVFNAILSFFALIFALAALWKWLAIKK